MLPYRDSRLMQAALVVFFLVVLGYAYFEARGLLFGPSIEVASAPAELHEQFIMISGKADRISTLRMNGKTVPVTEDGAFEQPYILAPGYNRIVFDASDKYGRTTHKTLELIYTPSASDSTALGTAAPASSTSSIPLTTGYSAQATTSSSTEPVTN